MRKQLAVFLAIALIGAICFLSLPIGGVTINSSTGYLSISTNVALAVNTIEEPVSSPVSNPPMTWYEANYSYCKSFNITNTTAGAQTDYQMKLLVNKNSGSDGSGTVNLSGHCEDDFDDIRFTNATGTVLDYWAETINAGDNATVWVELDNVNATGNTSFSLYYGNSTVTSASNGTNTFIAFDDFNDNSFDTAKWARNNATTILEQNARIECSDSAGAYKNVVSLDTFAGQFELRSLVQKATATTSGHTYVNMGDANTDHNHFQDGAMFSFYPGSAIIYCVTHKTGVSTQLNFAATHTAGTYYWLILQRLSTGKVKYTLESAAHTFIETQTPNSTPTLATAWYVFPIQAVKSAATTTAYCDVTFIKKFVDTEPTWGSWGSQEVAVGQCYVTNGVGVTNLTTTNATLNGNLTDDGGENCTAIIYWGDNDGVITSGDWDNNETIGTDLTNGTFYTDVSDLTNVTYYYRCYANNTAGSDWADSTVAFKQPAITNEPDSYDFETVMAGETYSTGLTAFNVTNTGDVPVNISIQGTNMTGGIFVSGTETEEQTQYNASSSLYHGGSTRGGQRLTISNRTVTKLAFYLSKVGTPTGNITFTIRDLSNNVLNSKVWGLAETLIGDATQYEATFETPGNINEEVRILAEFDGGNFTNYVQLWYQNSDVIGGYITVYLATWYDYPAYDSAYKYTYEIYSDYSWTLNDTATPGADIYGLKAGVNNITEVTEEQTTYSGFTLLYPASASRVGQYLTITNRTVTNLAFSLSKYGSPTGDVDFTIRYVSNDTIINSKTWGNASDLTTGATWYNVTFDAPINVNGDVRILAEFAGGNSSNYVKFSDYGADVKASEYLTDYLGGSYYNSTAYDGAYIYTYFGYNTTVKLNSPYNNLCTNLSVNATQGWGLKLYTPTSFSDGYEKSGVVTLTATEA
ncbi:MAG TPA: DUF2341 domain-containing protein [Dehalococcoidia bacterium]|nr:DUF2341 domain-containing protein [Dehalococcoidia bacterium]